MKDFVEYVVKHLVDKPEVVVIEEKIEDEKKVIYSLHVDSNDVGKVIGRHGKTALAIRTLLTAVAGRDGKRALLEIIDQKESS